MGGGVNLVQDGLDIIVAVSASAQAAQVVAQESQPALWGLQLSPKKQ